ncbi:MAG: hypothetical protein HQK49_01030 [Oligoflexia bacterium]|nr:hypothetical protein [Oligoflexia bacterium]
MATIKNWLIRTRTNQILGPVSKIKIKELISNHAMGPNDEISSGNGHWFFIKEKDLVQKYVFEDNIQSFNPISEAKDVVSLSQPPQPQPQAQNIKQENTTSKLSSRKFVSATGEEVLLPSQNDLEYPDVLNEAPETPPSLDICNQANPTNQKSNYQEDDPEDSIVNGDITVATSLSKLTGAGSGTETENKTEAQYKQNFDFSLDASEITDPSLPNLKKQKTPISTPVSTSNSISISKDSNKNNKNEFLEQTQPQIKNTLALVKDTKANYLSNKKNSNNLNVNSNNSTNSNNPKTPAAAAKKRDDRFLILLLTIIVIALVFAVIYGLKFLKMYIKT